MMTHGEDGMGMENEVRHHVEGGLDRDATTSSRYGRALERFRTILAQAPADFQEEYGAEMEGVFLRRLTSAPPGPRRWILMRRELSSLSRVVREIAGQPSGPGGNDHPPPSEPGGPRGVRGSGVYGQLGSWTILATALFADLRFGLRSLRRNPTFALMSILTLGIGIGATTGIFTVVNHVVLQPLPYGHPEDLVRIYSVNAERSSYNGAFSLPNFEDLRRDASAASAMAAYWQGNIVLTGTDRAVELQSAYVTSGFFETMGVAPFLGSPLQAEDEDGDNKVVVLSHGLWTERFGADSTLVGRTILLDLESYRVAGVMPPDFHYPTAQADVWTFLSTIPASSIPLHLRQVTVVSVVGRLAPGTSITQLESQLEGLMIGLEESYPEINNGRRAARVAPLQDVVLGDIHKALWVLFGAVGFILLIACVNVASLQLVRGAGRKVELAVRSSLGASRSRVVRQLLTESLLIGGAGAILGLLGAVVGVDIFISRASTLLPRVSEISVDSTALAFAASVAMVTVLVFAIVPAFTMSRRNPAPTLREGGRDGSGSHRSILPGVLIATEVGLALTLLVGAGLLGRSLLRLQEVDPGFNPENTLAITYTISTAGRESREEWMGLYQDFLERVENMPGVIAAGSIRTLPLMGEAEQISYVVPGVLEAEPGAEPYAQMQQVSPNTFRALGIPLLSGRAIEATDNQDGSFVVVLSAGLAKGHFGEEDAVGRTLLLGGRTSVEIVGVVGDVRQMGLREEPAPTIYVSQHQVARVGMSMVVRALGDPTQLIEPIRAAMAELAPDQPITRIETLGSALGRDMAQSRFIALLLAVFSTAALILAAVGIYGTVAYNVTQRRKEMSLRMALGATSQQVIQRSIRMGMGPAIVGLVGGLIGAAALSQTLASLVYDVPTTDIVTYVGVAAVIALVALIASWFPARRASHQDPARLLG